MQVALLGDEGNESRVLQELAGVVELARAAMNAGKKLNIVYAGEGSEQPGERVVQVHDIVSAGGRFYLIAWCELADDWRRFRCDRVLDASMHDGGYELRTDVPLVQDRGDLFEPPREGVDEVTIRFSPVISRWVFERYPEAQDCGDGHAEVTFKTASVDWLVRTVLQYGAEAEVLGPPAYREVVRRAVGAGNPVLLLPVSRPSVALFRHRRPEALGICEVRTRA